MMDLIKRLFGSKTKLDAIVSVIAVALYAFGVIPKEIFLPLVALLGALGLWCLRDALK